MKYHEIRRNFDQILVLGNLHSNVNFGHFDSNVMNYYVIRSHRSLIGSGVRHHQQNGIFRNFSSAATYHQISDENCDSK